MTTTLFNPPKKEKNHHLDCRSRCDVCLDYIHSFFLIFMLKKKEKEKEKVSSVLCSSYPISFINASNDGYRLLFMLKRF